MTSCLVSSSLSYISVAVVTVLGEVHDALVVVLVRLSVDDSQPVLWHSVSHDDSLQ